MTCSKVSSGLEMPICSRSAFSPPYRPFTYAWGNWKDRNSPTASPFPTAPWVSVAESEAAQHMSILLGSQISLRDPQSYLFFPKPTSSLKLFLMLPPEVIKYGKLYLRWEHSSCSQGSQLFIIISCKKKFFNEVLTEEFSVMRWLINISTVNTV